MQKILLDGSKISHLADEPIDFTNLAFIGDAIWAIYCKGIVLSDPGNKKLADIHTKSNQYINAAYQAKFLQFISKSGILDDNELDFVRRARNTKINPTRKNITQYRYATAFEALIGLLYIKNQDKMYAILNEINSFQWTKD